MMMEEKNLRKQLKNARGRRLLEKTKLEYSRKIIESLEKDYSLFEEILNELEITEQEFLGYISGDIEANVTFFDQVLVIINKKIGNEDDTSKKKLIM